MRGCMGGFCAKRDKCPHYTAADRRSDDGERLCIPGRDGIRQIESAAFRVTLVNVFTGRAVAVREAT